MTSTDIETATAQLSTNTYQHLYDLIETRTGLLLNEQRRAEVARVVEDMLAKGKLKGPDSLASALATQRTSHPLWQELVRAITVGETYFFRNQAHFNALRNHVLPELIARRRESGYKHLRLWSAGCATGEEPYSLAMLLRELLPDIESWQITLLATDVNVTSLEIARRGVYRPLSFRNETPEYIRERWFTSTPAGYVLDPTIRNMVTFAPLNLVADAYPSYENGTMGIDLLICRNVTIYFDAEVTREVVGRFYRALVEGGWLVVGHAEPLSTTYQGQGFAPRNFPNAVLYQKDTRQEKPSASLLSWLVPSAGQSVPLADQPAPAPSPSVPPTEPAALISTSRPRPEQPAPSAAQPPPEAPQMDSWMKARLAADQGDWERALAWLEKAEQENVLQPQVHYLRALIQMQYNDVEGALLSLRQSLYCDPNFALAHYTLGDLYARRQEYKRAARHWRQTLRAVADREPQDLLPFAEDLTVEMLRALLAHRLETLGTRNGG